MFRVPTPRLSSLRRTFPIAIVVAVFAVAFGAFFVPTVAAAPAPPYFGPNGLVDRVPAYTGASPALSLGTDSVVYLAFLGWGGTTTQSDIFFTKSSDGRTWTVPIRVNNDAGGATQQDPSLALDAANRILIVWTDSRNGNNDVFFSKSTDGGLSFSSNVRVNDVTTNAQTEADLEIDHANPNLVHVVWTDTRNAFTTGPDIFYANSTDGGLSFNPSARVNNDAGAAEQGQPAIEVAANREIYVVWSDPRNGARGRDIYFSKSTDLGATWTPNIALNDDPFGNVVQQEPTIAVNATGAIFVAWTDFRSANTAPDIWATRSTNAGSSFTSNVKVNDEVGAIPQTVPSLATNAGKIVAAWADGRNGGGASWDIYVSSSADGLTWSSNMKANDDSLTAFQYSPTVGVDAAGDVFAAWLDTRAAGQNVFAGVLDVNPPTADAGAALVADQGTAIGLDGTGSADNLGIESSAWDFGDGSSATGASPTHTYRAAGVYTATLTVWDYSGNSATSTTTVTVRDTEAPVVLGGGDRVVEEGQALFFDASASRDNVGVTAYAWNFGDGSNATTATANHVYAGPGVYTATLTVTDAAGNSATTTFTVTVPSNAFLGWIRILAAVVGILALAVGLLLWMVFGRWRRERSPPNLPASGPQTRPRAPPQEPDPLDMTFPPGAPPNSP